MKPTLILTLVIFVLAGALVRCTSEAVKETAPTKFPHPLPASVDCRETASRFGRFAAVAEQLCQSGQRAERGAALACLSSCVERCPVQR